VTDLSPRPAFLQWTLSEIAALVGGTIQGEREGTITGVASVEEAEPGDLVFAESARFLAAALSSRATAILTTPETAAAFPDLARPLLLVADPRAAFVRVLEAFAPSMNAAPGIHPSAHIGTDVRLGAEIHIGADVTVGDDVILGDRVHLLPGTRIGDGCEIGDETILFPNVVLYPRVRIGKRCRLHAGCVIGADGFGYIPVGMALKKVPHLGTVEIGDDVEMGANCCVDRAKTGATVVGPGTKLDNLVHVGHNARVGASCLLIAQVGIAGSATLGNGVILAGQSGVVDHVTLGDGVRVAAQSGVIGNVPAGQTVTGFPARPHAKKMREYAAAAELPEALKRLRALEKRLAELEARQDKE